MNYFVRNAEMQDLSRVNEIYAYARAFMKKTGNPNQWGNNTPETEQLITDIQERKLFVICEDAIIHGVFFFWIGPDPTYFHIEDGNWRSDTEYGTIHRIAGDSSRGILHTAVSFAKTQIKHLRIDTHHDNWVMQKAVAKQGFQRRGVIYIEDGSPRIAYDYLIE